jgi:glyoxylate reductase
MPKVFISRRIGPEAIDLITPHAEVIAWKEEEAPAREELFRLIADKEGLIVWLDKVDSEFLDAAQKVKVIAHRAAGFDNIDVDEATKRGIMICNAPRGVIEATADFTFGLLLACARKIVEAVNTTFRGEWKIWEPMSVPYLGDDVHHRTLGIVGMGRIGSEVAKRAQGFSMKVIYYDIVRNPREAELGAEYISDLPTLLSMSDFVTIHTPLNRDTRHLIGAKELATMKPTAILVNASRGGTVDQKALYEALKGKQIQAAAIDVTEKEPIASDDPLLTLDNIIISPHIAGGSKAARLGMDSLAAENIIAALKGEPMPSCVNCHLLDKK